MADFWSELATGFLQGLGQAQGAHLGGEIQVAVQHLQSQGYQVTGTTQRSITLTKPGFFSNDVVTIYVDERGEIQVLNG